MGKIKYIKASTIIEAMVASILFLLAFSIGIESIIKAASIKSDTLTYLSADNQYMKCLYECKNHVYSYGEHIIEFEWGEITLILEPYNNYEQILQATIRVKVGHEVQEYIHILEK